MSCVACAGRIEDYMKREYEPKKMVEINVTLLCHKMSTSFLQSAFANKLVTPEMICSEIT